MIQIDFDDLDLEDLILRGSSRNRFYKKLSRNAGFMGNLIKVYNIMSTVECVESLKDFGSLHYEQLKHKLAGKSSVRVGFKTKYRLIFTEHDNGIRINLLEINEHYGDK